MRKHAVTVAFLSLFVCLLIDLPRAQAATYYISSSLGNDANTAAQAQSKVTPWAHLPGMPSARDACASFAPQPGDNFILRGGDTWTAADLGVDWGWSGRAGARIYIGVDQTWFKGATWTRPIFNCGNAPCAGPQRQQMWISGAYVTVDNLEFTGLRQVGGSVQNVAVYSDHDEIMNCYFHGWSRAAGETDNGTSFAITANWSMGEARVAGSSFHDNVIDGSDTTRDMWGGILFGERVYNNVIRYVVSAMLGNFTRVHGNLMEHNVYSYGGDHANLMFIFGPFNGSINVYAYNNVVRHNRLAPGSMGFWINGNSGGHPEWVSYAFNNVIYDVDNGVMALGSHPYSGETGTYYVFNNTIDGNGGYAMGNGESPPRSVTHFANNHCVNCFAYVCTTGTTAINDGGNLLQSLAQANASAYTASQSYAYSPTSAASPTVAAGVNLSSWCSGELAAMASDTLYPTYDEVNHRVVMRTVVARPTAGTWDIGAYQFAKPSTALAITSQPASRTVCVGQTATFAVTAVGTAPLSYQWQKNSASISGATSANYTTPAATHADSASTYRCVVSNSAGNVTSNPATLTVSNLPPTIVSAATAAPSSAYVGQSVALSLVASDPDGDSLSYSWNFGDGTNASGAGTTHTYAAAGTFTATATISDGFGGSVSSSASVTVVAAPVAVRINSGGSAVGAFVADTAFAGGKKYRTRAAINLTGVTSPASQAVYQTERYGNFTYTIGGLAPTLAYTVRLHFAEIYWTAAGRRIFNVSINGESVLSNFDIFAATGARYQALVREFDAAANGSGQIVVAFATVRDNAKISGLELVPNLNAPAALAQDANAGAAALPADGSPVIDLGSVKLDSRLKLKLPLPEEAAGAKRLSWRLAAGATLPPGAKFLRGRIGGTARTAGVFELSVVLGSTRRIKGDDGKNVILKDQTSVTYRLTVTE